MTSKAQCYPACIWNAGWLVYDCLCITSGCRGMGPASTAGITQVCLRLPCPAWPCLALPVLLCLCPALPCPALPVLCCLCWHPYPLPAALRCLLHTLLALSILPSHTLPCPCDMALPHCTSPCSVPMLLLHCTWLDHILGLPLPGRLCPWTFDLVQPKFCPGPQPKPCPGRQRKPCPGPQP